MLQTYDKNFGISPQKYLKFINWLNSDDGYDYDYDTCQKQEQSHMTRILLV